MDLQSWKPSSYPSRLVLSSTAPPSSTPARPVHLSYTYSWGARSWQPAPGPPGPRSGGAWPGATGWAGGRREEARGRRHPIPPRELAGPRQEPSPSGPPAGFGPAAPRYEARSLLETFELRRNALWNFHVSGGPPGSAAGATPAGTWNGGGRSSPVRRRAPIPAKPEALWKWEVPEKQVPDTFPRWGSRAQGSGYHLSLLPREGAGEPGTLALTHITVNKAETKSPAG